MTIDAGCQFSVTVHFRRWLRPLLSVVLIAACVLATASGRVVAHEGASGVVKDRMEDMKGMAAATKTLKAALGGGMPSERGRAAARTIVHTAKRIPELFPKGSRTGPSEAGPSIWTARTRFESLAADLAAHAEALANAVAAGDRRAARRAFRDVAQTCSACHEHYREKKNN